MAAMQIFYQIDVCGRVTYQIHFRRDVHWGFVQTDIRIVPVRAGFTTNTTRAFPKPYPNGVLPIWIRQLIQSKLIPVILVFFQIKLIVRW